MDPGLQIHPSIFGFFKNEIPEGQRIKLFVTMGSKNYSYDCEDVVTKKVVQRVVKIRGLTLKGDMSTAIDTNQMLDFVEKIQENKRIEKSIPQFRLRINNATKIISATKVFSLYSNVSNDRRYYAPSLKNSTRLWPYGTTSYDIENKK